MVLTLQHQEILRPQASVHLSRGTLTPQRPKQLHAHDFYELFWVQNGKVRHHTSAGVEMLAEGDMIFSPPGPAHALQGKGEHAMVVTLCFHPDVIDGLLARHAALQGRLFWGDRQRRLARNIQQMARLNNAALQLERSDQGAMAAEAFLLPLCAELLTTEALPQDAPDWLLQACIAARAPEVFRGGAAAFVALTGRAHPHVSRTMRRYMGATPSEYVNQQRMQYAAQALVGDADSIAVIAAACGLPNLSHFHKLFRASFEMTPHQFRQQFQRQVLQPA